jgi:hypothetical protein
MKNILKIPLIVGMALTILVPTGFVMKAYSIQLPGEAERQAKLAYCYDLLEDIGNDFGWWWQAQKRVNYNNACGELTGYIDNDAVRGN